MALRRSSVKELDMPIDSVARLEISDNPNLATVRGLPRFIDEHWAGDQELTIVNNPKLRLSNETTSVGELGKEDYGFPTAGPDYPKTVTLNGNVDMSFL